MTPHFGFGAQALHGIVEDADEILHVELAERLATHRHHVNLRLFHLDHRAAGVGEIVELLVEGLAQRHGALDRVLVVAVDRGGGKKLRQDGAELDRLCGQALGHFPHGGVLQVAGPDGSHDLGKDAGFEIIVQDVSARKGDRADIVDRRLGGRVEPRHVRQRIALPAHAADFLVVVRIAVGADIKARRLLSAQMHRDRVLVLLAVAGMEHRFEKALGAENGGVPRRPRQRTDDRCRQCFPG